MRRDQYRRRYLVQRLIEIEYYLEAMENEPTIAVLRSTKEIWSARRRRVSRGEDVCRRASRGGNGCRRAGRGGHRRVSRAGDGRRPVSQFGDVHRRVSRVGGVHR
jgi:hypothetical protein